MLKLATVFIAVFLAELGDKTQIATLLFASDSDMRPLPVFFAAASALVIATALAVLLGHFAGRWLEILPLKLIAGAGFIAIGVWTVAEHFRAA